MKESQYPDTLLPDFYGETGCRWALARTMEKYAEQEDAVYRVELALYTGYGTYDESFDALLDSGLLLFYSNQYRLSDEGKEDRLAYALSQGIDIQYWVTEATQTDENGASEQVPFTRYYANLTKEQIDTLFAYGGYNIKFADYPADAELYVYQADS